VYIEGVYLSGNYEGKNAEYGLVLPLLETM
jgi:hypothetical protein